MKYNIIYADPPWNFKTWSEKGEDRSPKYPVMDLNRIKNLDVQSISEEKSCVLFLWSTSPMLKTAIEVMESWGFTYKTVAFTWVKLNKVSDKFFTGLGYYTRANAEYVLLGLRGRPMPRINKGVSSLYADIELVDNIVFPEHTIVTRIGEHSVKPDEVRERIEEVFGWYPAIELFARKKNSGWDSIGNEITGNDIAVDIERIKNS